MNNSLIHDRNDVFMRHVFSCFFPLMTNNHEHGGAHDTRMKREIELPRGNIIKLT